MAAAYDVENSLTGEITEMVFEDQREANKFFIEKENAHLSRVRLFKWEVRDVNTGEVKEVKFKSYEDYKVWLETQPHLASFISKPPNIAGDHITIRKDTGFKEVLQKIHERTPGSQLDKTSSQL